MNKRTITHRSGAHSYECEVVGDDPAPLERLALLEHATADLTLRERQYARGEAYARARRD